MAETGGQETMQVSSRQIMAMALGLSRTILAREQKAFGGDRNYYEVLGYAEDISFEQYMLRYRRQDIAKRVVDLPANDTWKKPPPVTEDGDNTTPFVQDWNKLLDNEGLGVFGRLKRADRLSGIGSFGILFMGFNDGVEDLEQPVNVSQLNAPEDLIYLTPFHEGMVEVHEVEEDVTEPRYNLPTIYKIKLTDDDKLDEEEGWKKVHHSRVLHLAEDKIDNEVYGTPRMEPVFNLLDDMIKLVGGGAEATWLNMRQGTLLRPIPDEEVDTDSVDMSTIKDELQEYAHDPLRMLWLANVEAEEIGRDRAVNVKEPFEIALSLLSAARGIPQRVLIGAAQGEMSAAREDMRQWAGEVAQRQKNYAEPEILRTFIDTLIQYGVLSPPRDEGYNVGTKNKDGEWEWPPLVQMTEEERAEIRKNEAQAVKALSDATSDYIASIPERREMLGFSREQTQEFLTNADEVMNAIRKIKKGYEEGRVTPEGILDFTAGLWSDVLDMYDEIEELD